MRNRTVKFREGGRVYILSHEDATLLAMLFNRVIEEHPQGPFLDLQLRMEEYVVQDIEPVIEFLKTTNT